MIPFLKYEQFFLYINPGGSLVNGVIGSVPGFRHFKTVLTDIFPKTVPSVQKKFENATGAIAIARPYSEK